MTGAISYLMLDLSRVDEQGNYTVGKVDGDGFYVQIPWHLRGTAAELMEQFVHEYCQLESRIPANCFGFEFRDEGVQLIRYKFPWLRRDGD